jgi:hypothetical protein
VLAEIRGAPETLRKRDLPYIEKLLSGTGDSYLCGEFSLADTPLMALAMVLEVDKLGLGDFPRVEKYLNRLRELAELSRDQSFDQGCRRRRNLRLTRSVLERGVKRRTRASWWRDA